MAANFNIELKEMPCINDIVYGFFPCREHIGDDTKNHKDIIAQNDPHFLLVLNVYEEEKYVLVLFGTSYENKKGQESETSIVIKKNFNVMGLKWETIFDFHHESIAYLPYTLDWFTWKNGQASPITGKLSSEYKNMPMHIIKNHKYIQNIIRFLENGNTILPKKYHKLECFNK